MDMTKLEPKKERKKMTLQVQIWPIVYSNDWNKNTQIYSKADSQGPCDLENNLS